MWPPLFIELRDTRLPHWQPRKFEYMLSRQRYPQAATLDVEVRYHMLTDA